MTQAPPQRVVGILGGMGPEATILLQQRLLARIDARDDSDHLPLLIDMNPKVPSRIAHLIERTGPSPAPTLAAMAQRLERAGATALAMPCNTAHHYAPEITRATAIPFLNMVELSVAQAATSLAPGDRIGFLASPAVRMAAVFDGALERAGLHALWPANTDPLLAAIRLIKAQGPVPEALEVLNGVACELAGAGAAMLFVACSEFSLLTRELKTALPALDTVDVLARAIQHHTRAHEVSK
jgi:aspartate racemase